MKEKNELKPIKYNKKNINRANIVFNASICLTSAILSSFNPLVIAGSYILCDILSVPMNILLLKIKINSTNNIKILKNFEKKLDDTFYYTKYNSSDREMFKYLKKLVSKKINKINLKEELERQKIEQKNESSKLDKTLQAQKDIFKNGINTLKNFEYENSIIPEKEYKKILKNVSKIESLLEKNEQGYIFVDTTFTLFSNEVVNLLKSFSIMGEDISKENKEKMNTLLDSFNDYLERTINKIMTQNETTINASYEVVLKNINKTN